MSEFNNGGGTLVSENKVAALLESAYLLSEAERQASTPENPLNRISMTIDAEAGSATFNSTIPFVMTYDAGDIKIRAQNYITNEELSAFDSGAGGDLTATNVVDAYLQIAQNVAASERLIRPNIVTVTPNTVTIIFDSEAGVATITSNIPIQVVRDELTGQLTVQAIDFLP